MRGLACFGGWRWRTGELLLPPDGTLLSAEPNIACMCSHDSIVPSARSSGSSIYRISFCNLG